MSSRLPAISALLSHTYLCNGGAEYLARHEEDLARYDKDRGRSKEHLVRSEKHLGRCKKHLVRSKEHLARYPRALREIPQSIARDTPEHRARYPRALREMVRASHETEFLSREMLPESRDLLDGSPEMPLGIARDPSTISAPRFSISRAPQSTVIDLLTFFGTSGCTPWSWKPSRSKYSAFISDIRSARRCRTTVAVNTVIRLLPVVGRAMYAERYDGLSAGGLAMACRSAGFSSATITHVAPRILCVLICEIVRWTSVGSGPVTKTSG